MPHYTLWHNPRCSKSRAALDLLRERGIEPELRLYLDDPPSTAELSYLAGMLGSARRLLRESEPDCAELGLSSPDVDDAALLAALAAHPHLIQRPVLVRASAAGTQAEIGRPTERLLSFLDS